MIGNTFHNNKAWINEGLAGFNESENNFTNGEPFSCEGGGGTPPPVEPPAEVFEIVTGSRLPTAKVGEPYEPIPLIVRGGKVPFRYAASNLPDGLFFNEFGVFNFTGSAAGRFNDIKIEVRDADEKVARKIFSIEVLGATEPPIDPPPTPARVDTIEVDVSRLEKILFILRKEDD